MADIERSNGAGSRRSAIMISSVTGENVTHDTLANPDYWVTNMVSPVRFVDAMGCSLIASSAEGHESGST